MAIAKQINYSKPYNATPFTLQLFYNEIMI